MTELLEKKFEGKGEVKGFYFTQLLKGEKMYLYGISYNSSNKEANFSHYELILRRETAKCINFDKKIFSDTEFKEIYPKAKDFGTYGWSFTNLQKAKDIFYKKH